jgi:hypothetical protein
LGQNIAGRENLTCASFIGPAFFQGDLMWAGHFCRECVGNPIYASHAASRHLGSSKSTLGDGATACAYRRAQRLGPAALVEAADEFNRADVKETSESRGYQLPVFLITRRRDNGLLTIGPFNDGALISPHAHRGRYRFLPPKRECGENAIQSSLCTHLTHTIQ